MAYPVSLVAVLWQGVNFGGPKRVFVFDEPDLNNTLFNDQAFAIGIHPGPGYVSTDPPQTISFFEDSNFGGRELLLPTGTYPDLTLMGFDQVISSIRFNGPDFREPGLYVNGQIEVGFAPTGPAATISPIPLVVQLFSPYPNTGLARAGGIDFTNYLFLVQSSLDLGAEYGSEWAGTVQYVIVEPGPSPTGKVRLYRDAYPDQPNGFLQGGGYIELPPRFDPNVIRDYNAYDLQLYDFVGLTHAVSILYEPLHGFCMKYHTSWFILIGYSLLCNLYPDVDAPKPDE